MNDAGDIENIETLLLARLKSVESELAESRIAVIDSRKREVASIN